MPGKYIKMLSLSLLVTSTLVSCSVLKKLKITLTDEKICSVAGDLSVGLDCATMISHTKSEMNMDEAIEFLNKDAIIMSSNSFKQIKTTIDTACLYAKAECTEELKQSVQLLSEILDYHEGKKKYQSPLGCFGFECNSNVD